MGRRKPKIAEHVPDSDDEEIDEDEAFNSDDERKYGEFFAKGSASGDESGSDSSSDDDDDEEGDGGQYMLDLLDQLNDSKPQAKQKPDTDLAAAVHTKESPCDVTAASTGDAVTLDSLLQGIQDTQGFGSLQKNLQHLAPTTDTPVARVVADRASRKVQYAAQQQTMGEWSAAVQTNRQAETLDFRPKERLEVTRDVMLAKFVPTTDLEKEIHAALEAAGGGEEEALRQAEDDLGHQQLTIEEYRERRNQLAKMRALLFYHEQKRHKIKKIKSKQYRRIRKRQREKQKEVEAEENPELVKELQEKEVMERMKERASLAHKNTSKWAKRILKRGKNVDVDTRKALSAQLKRGEDLRKRMQSTAEQSDGDDDDEDLITAARKTLEETEVEQYESNGKSLFQLEFMKNGAKRQREKAKEEARQLLLELEASNEERPDEEDDELQPKKRKAAKAASAEEMKSVLKEGDLMVSSIKHNQVVNVSIDDNVDVSQFQRPRVEEMTTTFEQDAVKTTPRQPAPTALTRNETSATQVKVKTLSLKDDNEANPWMPSTGKAKASKASKSSSVRGYVDVERAVDLLDSTPKEQEKTNETSLIPTAGETKLTLLSQEQLVQKAFAGPSMAEMEGELAAEKEIVRQEEAVAGRKKKRKDREMTSSSGWGSWAGNGIVPSSKQQRPSRPETTVAKRRDDKRPNVIISQARIKRTANKYMLSDVPYPFTCREEYEKSLAGGIGPEWNVTSSFKSFTRPEIVTRAGKIIKPISKKMKVKRAPAKF